MAVKMTINGHVIGAASHTEALVALAQAVNKVAVNNAVSQFTGSLFGSANTTLKVAATNLTNQANNNGDLADATSAGTSFTKIHDGLRELATKANAIAAALGITQITYNGGGAAPDSALDTITVATAAATGAQATQVNNTFDKFNSALVVIARFVNRLAEATGEDLITLDPAAEAYNFASTVSAITPATGTAADPGVKQTAFNNQVTELAKSMQLVANRINTIRAALNTAPITFV